MPRMSFSLVRSSADTRRIAEIMSRLISFGEQTAIKIGKGSMTGITLSWSQVTEWIDSFPISAYISDILEHCYYSDFSDIPHIRRKVLIKDKSQLDENYWQRISTEHVKCSHPLESNSDVLFNIFNGQVAQTKVNVADSLVLGAQMANDFRTSLPTGFHAKLSSHWASDEWSEVSKLVSRWSSI